MINFKKHLFFTEDYSKALQEIEEAGGYVTQKFTNIVFAASLPEGFDTGTLKHAATEPAGQLDEISALMAEGWNSYMLTLLKQSKERIGKHVSGNEEEFMQSAKSGNSETVVGAYEQLQKGRLTIPAPTSEKLAGYIALGLILVSGPSKYSLSLSYSDKVKIIENVIAGAEYLAVAGKQAQVKIIFSYSTYMETIEASENKNCKHDCQAVFRDPVLNHLGYASGYQGCVDFINNLKAENHADWAYMAFFSNYYTGDVYNCDKVYTWFQYNSRGFSNKIQYYFARATCQIFGASTEQNCTCNPSGMNNVPNYNCADCRSVYARYPCIMSDFVFEICPWTMGQLGWINPKPHAGSRPFASVFNNGLQLHFFYRDASGRLSDIYYDKLSGWHYQNLSSMAPGALKLKGNPSAFVYPPFMNGNDKNKIQQHVMYRDENNNFSDIYYDLNSGLWAWRDIYSPIDWGILDSDLSVLIANVANRKLLTFYCRTDYNEIVSIAYDPISEELTCQAETSWNISASLAQGNVMGVSYLDGVVHTLYRDVNGHVSDIFFDLEASPAKYVNLNEAAPGTLPALGNPFGLCALHGLEMHCFYRDSQNKISDILYRYSSGWHNGNLHELLKDAPPAQGDPFAISYNYGFEIHCFYRDTNNQIAHIFYIITVGWGYQNLSEYAPDAMPAQGDPFVVEFENNGFPELHVVYNDVNNHISDVYWNGTKWLYRSFPV